MPLGSPGKEGLNLVMSLRGETVEFFVSDTGIGIAPEHQPKVFERFFQVESPSSKQFSGTGLGLSISKAYVELLGGSIWLISTPGEGSLFCFSIPYTKPHDLQGSAPTKKKKQSAKTKIEGLDTTEARPEIIRLASYLIFFRFPCLS